MLDYTLLHNYAEHTSLYTQLTCTLYLEKEDIIEALKEDEVMISNKIYKMPKEKLYELLVNETFGNVELTFCQVSFIV